MCGIFGSNDLERFKTLYDLNKDRGSFAYGGMYLHEEQQPVVQKTEGNSFQFEKTDLRYYMGHTQGPTSSQREFDHETSHPFQFEHWSVAHNGILSNNKHLAKEYEVDNPVDSAIIPKLISVKELDCRDEVHAIEQALEELEGTFSCWIYNELTENIYLARNSCTLFVRVNNNDCDFSSKYTHGMLPLTENFIYHVDVESVVIQQVGAFDSDSPFFVL